MPLKNAKHEAVALALIGDPQRVGWKAYQKVYPKASQRAAETAIGRLLKNAGFSSRIAELQAAAAAEASLSAAKVLDEIAKLAFANMADYMVAAPGGAVRLDFSKLTRDQAAALAEVTVEEFVVGAGDDVLPVRKIKFKLADKLGALVALGKHFKLFTEKHEHTGKDGGPIETRELSKLELARRIAFILRSATALPAPSKE